MKTKIPRDGWFKVGQEKLAHLLEFAAGRYAEFYCGKSAMTDLNVLDKNCFNRCWRCIEAYERN